MGRCVNDTGVAVGEYTYGSGTYADAPADYDGGPAVLLRILEDESRSLKYQYRVVLRVSDIWKGRAIAAILNAG